MTILNRIFMASGMISAFYFGYAGFEWFYIFVSGLLLTMGWAVVRPRAMYSVQESDGTVGTVKLFAIQIIMMSLFAGLIFSIGYLFS